MANASHPIHVRKAEAFVSVEERCPRMDVDVLGRQLQNILRSTKGLWVPLQQHRDMIALSELLKQDRDLDSFLDAAARYHQ